MIYSCLPQKVSRIWGSLPPEKTGMEPVGEIWWFFGDTILKNDSSENETRRASEFFPSDSFPLIIKTLHTARDLSVQVHPGKNRSAPMKDESWVILEGRGKVMHGAIEGTTPEKFSQAVKEGTVEKLLDYMDVEPGMFIHLPAGTIHALGAGLNVLEVQLNCTVTYRLWDYARRDITGNMRELHIEKGLAAIDWDSMGRATRIFSNSLSESSYSMRKAGPGQIVMKPLEVAFLTDSQECFFADSAGGVLAAAGDSWIMGM